MPTCSTDDGIWCCSRCDISSPHIARWKWLRCRCLPRCVLCEACSHTPCPSCGATEDGKLLELDDAVSFSASSSFVSDITDDSNLADMLWQILSRAVKGWSTNDLRQACGLRKADDLIALLSRWENKKIVVQVGSTCKEENAVQSLWWTSAKYKHVIEEERTRIYYRLQVQKWEGLRRRIPCAVDGCILGNEEKLASLLSTLAEATDLSTINLLTDGHVIEEERTRIYYRLQVQWEGLRRRMPCAVDGCILGNEKKIASLLSTLAEATDLSTINLLTDGHVIEEEGTRIYYRLQVQWEGLRRRMPCAVDGCILGNEKKIASLLSTLAEATDLSTINLLTDGQNCRFLRCLANIPLALIKSQLDLVEAIETSNLDQLYRALDRSETAFKTAMCMYNVAHDISLLVAAWEGRLNPYT